MAEMTLYIITVALAVYGLSCLIRLIWSLIVRANHDSSEVLMVALRDDLAEFSLRHSVELANNCGIPRVVAINCGVQSETMTIARMIANSEPAVEIYDINDSISKIIN